IVEDLDRTMLGYELIKQLNKATEDHPEPEYFELLHKMFEALDDAQISLELARFWFAAQLLRLGGHAPNLRTDTTGQALDAGKMYGFDFGSMALQPQANGAISADHIKFLRLSF